MADERDDSDGWNEAPRAAAGVYLRVLSSYEFVNWVCGFCFSWIQRRIQSCTMFRLE